MGGVQGRHLDLKRITIVADPEDAVLDRDRKLHVARRHRGKRRHLIVGHAHDRELADLGEVSLVSLPPGFDAILAVGDDLHVFAAARSLSHLLDVGTSHLDPLDDRPRVVNLPERGFAFR